MAAWPNMFSSCNTSNTLCNDALPILQATGILNYRWKAKEMRWTGVLVWSLYRYAMWIVSMQKNVLSCRLKLIYWLLNIFCTMCTFSWGESDFSFIYKLLFIVSGKLYWFIALLRYNFLSFTESYWLSYLVQKNKNLCHKQVIMLASFVKFNIDTTSSIACLYIKMIRKNQCVSYFS